jgi:LPPG:FO 2-phospho-L-lactate transferase
VWRRRRSELAYGFARVLPSHDLAVIVNTGDDFEHLGLRICPDLDTVMYTLSGVDNRDTGWGRAVAKPGRDGRGWVELGGEDLVQARRQGSSPCTCCAGNSSTAASD